MNGDSQVGKSSLIRHYMNKVTWEDLKPTIGADFSAKETLIGNHEVTLQIWDTSGQEKYQSLGSAYYRGADCFVLVYDVTNRRSFENLVKWRQVFLDHANLEDPSSFPFLAIGNKVDRAG